MPSSTKPRQIVYIWDADYPWDVRTEKICRALTEAGNDVHIVARNRAWRPETERLPEGTVHRMRPWRWLGRRLDGVLGFPAFFSPRWGRFLARVLRAVGADLIIVRDLPLGPAALRAGRKLGIPVVLDMAEDYPAMIRAIFESGRARLTDYIVRNPSAVERVEHYCLRRADHVWVVSEMVRDHLVAAGVPFARVSVVGNTPPLDRLALRPKRPSRDAIEIVYLGLLEIPRGIGELIDAVKELHDTGMPYRLLLIGDGRDAPIFRAQAERHGLHEPVVTFAGFMPYEQALARAASADIGAMPLHRNDHMDTTIPNKLFDYMSLGLPVVTSDTPASAELVRRHDAGEVFRASDVSSLVEALRRLGDQRRRRESGDRGQEAVRQRYNWEADVKTLLDSVEIVTRDRR